MKRFTITILFFLLCGVYVFAQADLQPLVNVKLNTSESITLKQLKNRVESYKLQTGRSSFTVEEKKEILDGMINEKLIVQAAQKAGITFSDAEVNEFFLDNMAQQLGQSLTENQLAQLVKEQTGMSLDDYIHSQTRMSLAEYKAYLKNQLIAQRYIVSLKKDEIQSASIPTDAEIRAFYDLKKSEFFQNDIMKLFIVSFPKTGDEKVIRKKATDMLEQLRTSATSIDKIKLSAKTDSSFQVYDLFVNKTEQAAMQLGLNYQGLMELFTKSSGFISDLSATDVDFQFYVVTGKYDAKLLTLSDVIQPESNYTVYEYIRENLALQKQSQFLTVAVQEVTNSLRTPQNYQMIKNGAALDALLADW